ncbi:hypothetical protein OSB04_009117 [Centaurea solstitialis]|uniref:Reverse transcriptase Ty1/copia-type domain-containing protein n=1 Tax=Centaurea solstitialis TaxID=347529 RepID=A0AA38WK27_9ASTR|nr:hypothetical protein OSB04_009117 [Centaurea solstitialis]
MIPKNIHEALSDSDPKWMTSVIEEMKAMEENKTLEVVKFQQEEKYKVKLVYQGYTQTYGIDYEETFTLIEKLNEELDQVHGSHILCPGMKQFGYVQSQADHSMFVKHSSDVKKSILLVYVDDMIIIGNDSCEIENLKRQLHSISKHGIFTSQRKYVLSDLLREIGKLAGKPTSTPIEQNRNSKISDNDPLYQRLVGKLIYLSLTRLDIVAYSASVVSQYMNSPAKRLLEAIQHILKYLKGTLGKGLLFWKTDMRDVGGLFMSIGEARAILSQLQVTTLNYGGMSNKQIVVSRSSAEAEYRAIAQ